MPTFTNALSDQDIVNDMLKDSKFAIHSLSVALGESTSTVFREKLVNQLNSCIDNHFKLSDFAAQKNWYQPYQSPEQQLQEDINTSLGFV
ncbi:spore coat protein [Desulfosporosinus hippei]|uniref:Similar to spore coat protein n=1 Tax=Desulfosporosinus hippei DSM 8344 TaxID=1121419 RepID=A0A1G8IF18_9FIRM|nr:spore coat protein [Desulfosporosinus hippei]SDI17619.1 similar to spore coat protein [Desulfosporosinus hippei DSM 8344]